MTGIRKKNITFKLTLALLSIGFLSFFSGPAVSGPRPGREKIKAIIIGDRLVDIAYNLGVVPDAMVVRCWGALPEKLTTVQFLGCPKRVVIKEKETVPNTAREKGLKRILIEKNEHFDIYLPEANPMNIVPLLESKGLQLEFVDFSEGIESAIRQAGKLLKREKRAEELITAYKAALQKTKRRMPQEKLGKKVLILKGILVKKTGKPFIHVVAPNGYADRFFLEPMGCTNVGHLVKSEVAKAQKGSFPLRNLENIINAQPDVIIITGKSFAVEKMLQKALMKKPSLREVPAIKNYEIYSLPGYMDEWVVEYPYILRLWISALYK